MSIPRKRPLEGYRVLDFATMVAAPFCGSILGEFGAEVIKVEMPVNGDPLRMFGERSATGSSYNWLSEARNRKCVTLDLRVPQGLELGKRLVAESDIVLENFRPGTLAKWGLGLEAMRKANRDVILVSVSAYGQDGPYRDRPGYARIAHGFSGLSHLTGEPDCAPAVPGASALADYIAGVYAAVGALLAMVGRNRFGEGQHVDISLYEGIFRMLDDLAPTYAKSGEIRNRLGADSTSAVPHSNYRTADGKWVALACSNDSMFERLAQVMDRLDLLKRFAHVDTRLAHRSEVNGIVADWVARFTQDELVALAEQGDVPLGRINTIADIFEDEHVRARGNLLSLEVELEGLVVVPGVFPHLRDTPGRVHSLGPRLGEHNACVYGELLGLGSDEIAKLQEQKVI
jgi:succinyl-CoA:(S)-malate CoA-transferase subunit A/succinyl-CoA:(S)-malate CoA-transferase subunit B